MVIQTYKNLLRTVVTMMAAFIMTLGIPAIASAASDYNCGAYGEGKYQDVCAASTTLENTGQPLTAYIVPVLLILAGIILLWRTRRSMKSKPDYQSQSRQ